MTHVWIVHELEELAQYARANRMALLAAALTEARNTAMLEIANLPDGGDSAENDDMPLDAPPPEGRCGTP